MDKRYIDAIQAYRSDQARTDIPQHKKCGLRPTAVAYNVNWRTLGDLVKVD